MSQIIKSFLQSQNLNQKDIDVYLDIYKHGQSFASSVATRTGIDRTTAYSVIKRLLRLGLITQTKVNEVSAYTALSPEIFMDKLDFEMEELKARKKSATLFSEEMRKIRHHSFANPKIRVFEGEQALINLYEETLIRNSQQKAFFTLKNIPPKVETYLKSNFIKSKLKKKVHSRAILEDNPSTRQYARLNPKSNRQTRLIKKLPFDIASEIILFGEHQVAIIDFNKSPFGLLIDSKTFYKTMSTLFDFVWESSA